MGFGDFSGKEAYFSARKKLDPPHLYYKSRLGCVAIERLGCLVAFRCRSCALVIRLVCVNGGGYFFLVRVFFVRFCLVGLLLFVAFSPRRLVVELFS